MLYIKLINLRGFIVIKFKNSQAGSFLSEINVSYFDYGVIKNPQGKQLFDYFKTDNITAEQRSKILIACPDAQFKTAHPSHAPEIIRCLICFPKAAFYRNKKIIVLKTVKKFPVNLV